MLETWVFDGQVRRISEGPMGIRFVELKIVVVDYWFVIAVSFGIAVSYW
jgi:hypothetical protein